jgi:hypothetical protein
MDAHNGGVEAQKGAWRVCRPVIADSYHFGEEQDADPVPDPH